MKHCTKCGNELGEYDAYCGRCGSAVEGRAPRRNAQEGGRRRQDRGHQDEHRPQRQPFTPALKTAEGAAQYNKLVSARKAAALARRKVLGVFALGCLAVAAVAAFLLTGAVTLAMWAMGGFLLFALLALLWGPGSLSFNEYYTIPGSKDAQGEHRCINCGHRGIYRKGAYKSDTVSAQCSKCGFHFWNESK